MRIIIEHDKDIDPLDAMDVVRAVIKEGKISTSGGVAHYCWVTTFVTLEISVITKRKKKGQGSDSFRVTKRISNLDILNAIPIK